MNVRSPINGPLKGLKRRPEVGGRSDVPYI